jgi:hypothetical protein
MAHLTKHVFCQDVGGIFFQLAIGEFNLVYDGVHDWVVTICPSGPAIVINGPPFDLPTLKLVALLQEDLGIDHFLSYIGC